MPALIRMAGETDVEFQKRTRPLLAMFSTALYREQILKMHESRSLLDKHLVGLAVRGVVDEVTWRPGQLRQPASTFTWEINDDARPAPAP